MKPKKKNQTTHQKKCFSKRFKARLKTFISVFTNPRFLICYGLSWCITNGWAYLLLFIGDWLELKWMQAIAGGYLAFLWLPATPEKLITLSLSVLLLRLLFPNDTKTLGVLKKLYQQTKEKHKNKKTDSSHIP